MMQTHHVTYTDCAHVRDGVPGSRTDPRGFSNVWHFARPLMFFLVGALALVTVAMPMANAASATNVTFLIEMNPTPGNRFVRDWMKAGGWGDIIEVRSDTSEDAIRQLRQEGFAIAVNLIAHPQTRRRQWEGDWKRPVPDVRETIERHLRAADGDPRKVIWQMFMEEDSSGVAFPQRVLADSPKTHAAAHALLRQRLAEAFEPARPYPEVRKWGLMGFASSAHAFAASGLDCVINERSNDDVDDLQTGLAFTRGAARQFGIQWGIDWSVWWGPIHGCVHRLPTGYHKRNFYLSYFAGADVLRVEGGDQLYLASPGKEYPLGTELDRFARFTRRHSAGAPNVPVAIIVPEDNGWITPPYWQTSREAWNYARIAYRPGDRGLDGFFSTAFPGSNFAMDAFPFGCYATNDPPASIFALSAVTPAYAPIPEAVRTVAPPIPFGRFTDRHAARKTIEKEGIDPSPYRPMGDSRWGDIFDVLTDKLSLNVLHKYRLAILVGPVKLTPGIKAVLRAFVEGGGKLIWFAGQVGSGDEDLSGLAMTPELRVGRAWKWNVGPPESEAFRYVPARLCEAKALARTPAGDVLVARHELGLGEVFTCLVPWGESGSSSLAEVSKHLLDKVIASVQPVFVEGLPVEWMSTTGADHRTVLVANHSGEVWQGSLQAKNVSPRLTICRELLTETPMTVQRTNGAAVVSLEIPPYDVRVIRWFISNP